MEAKTKHVHTTWLFSKTQFFKKFVTKSSFSYSTIDKHSRFRISIFCYIFKKSRSLFWLPCGSGSIANHAFFNWIINFYGNDFLWSRVHMKGKTIISGRSVFPLWFFINKGLFFIYLKKSKERLVIFIFKNKIKKRTIMLLTTALR